MKDWFYEKFVRKNPRVQKAYETYVQAHLEEHQKSRFKHWLVLLILSWKYRRSQINRLHTLTLAKLKDRTAKIRMEWIPGAWCYNIYVSQDGITYRFLEKTRHHVYTAEGLQQDQMYFFKFKVSMDGSRYSDFSEVLTISTVDNEQLFFMKKLTQKAENFSPSSSGKSQEKQKDSKSSKSGWDFRGSFPTEGQAQIVWTPAPGAIHYNLYRSEEGGAYRFLAQTRESSYLDREMKSGTSYVYLVKYTENGKKYREFPHTLQLRAPGEKFTKKNSGRLFEKGPESQASNRVSVMNFAKGLMAYDVISFDVFDTLLFRPFSSPSDLFMLAGERLDIMDFTQIRLKAEEESRQKNRLLRGNREVTLLEIYQLVAQETGIDPQKGADLEFSLECELCWANPYMLEVFHILAAQGKTLVALSDMYLPKELLTRLLSLKGYEDFEQVMVSCDYNCSKRDGGLYELLKERYPGSIVHIGDNRISDIEKAKEKGLDTRFYQNVNEAGNIFRARDMSRLAGSAYRGIVNAKLHSGYQQYTPYYEVGFVYTGIYVMGFCQWIYRYVQEHKIEKVLFLAREGDLYQKVFHAMYPDIPTEYVLWSRIGVVKTIVEKNRHPYLLQIVHHKANALYKSKIGTLLDRTGIGDLKKYLPDYRIKAEEFLIPENEKILRQLLIEHWEEVCGCYRRDQELLRQYLTRKTGGAKSVAVVDVGWSGNNVLQVKYLLEQVYALDCQAHCLLAAARNVNDTYMAAMTQKEEIKTYIFSNMQNKGLHDAHQEENHRLNSFFFEILTQSCTPTFLGFDKEGRFLYDIPEVENYEKNREIHQGTLDFVKEYQSCFRNFPYMLDISGHDAYMPFQYFSRNLLWLKKYFGGYIFGRDLFATQEKAVMESVEEVMEKAGIWEGRS